MPAEVASRSLPSRRARALVFGMGGAALAVGFGLLAWGDRSFAPLEGRPLLLYALSWSVPAAAVFVGLAFALHRAGRLIRGEFLRGTILGVLGCLFMGQGTVLIVNGALDHSSARSQRLPVVHKRTVGQSPATHYLVLAATPSGRGGHELRVPWHVYRRAEPGRSAVLLVTRPGRLGFPWIVRWELEP